MSIDRPRIAHLITNLNGFGGTEATLLRYLRASRIPLADQLVVVLREIGEGDTLGAQMVAAGVRVVALGQARGLVTPGAVLRLRRVLAAFRPDVVSAWLYHPCLLATLLAPLLPGRPRVVWHIRSLPFGDPRRKPGRFVVQRLLAAASRWTAPVLVSNSQAAVAAHRAIGFGGGAWSVIPNGLDLQRYGPDAADRAAVRREWGVGDSDLVLACVGRFVPEKGYEPLFDALSPAVGALPAGLRERLHLVAMGQGIDAGHAAFVQCAARAGLPAAQQHWLGRRADVDRQLRGADLFVLPSISESFPNSLVEAMATGLPCVSTDVGQCRELMPDPRWVVPAGDAPALGRAIAALAALDAGAREQVGRGNRARIVGHHGLQPMVQAFDALFSGAVRA